MIEAYRLASQHQEFDLWGLVLLYLGGVGCVLILRWALRRLRKDA